MHAIYQVSNIYTTSSTSYSHLPTSRFFHHSSSSNIIINLLYIAIIYFINILPITPPPQNTLPFLHYRILPIDPLTKKSREGVLDQRRKRKRKKKTKEKKDKSSYLGKGEIASPSLLRSVQSSSSFSFTYILHI